MALIERSWKGRTFTVMTLDGLDMDYVRDLAAFYFPEHIADVALAWAYVNYVGMRMRFTDELIGAMIQLRMESVDEDNSSLRSML